MKLYRASQSRLLPFKETLHNGYLALTNAQNGKFDSLAALIHLQLGILHWNNGNLKEADLHLDTALHKLEHRSMMKDVAQCLHYKGLVRYYLNEFDSALQLYEIAEHKYASEKDDSAVAKIKSHKGLIYSARGEYDRVIENMVASFRIQETMPGYRDLTLPVDLPTSTSTRVYYQTKLERDQESLNFLEGKPDSVKLAFTLFNIAKDYHYLREFDNSILYHRKSIVIAEKMQQLPFYQDLASVFVEAMAFDSAKKYYNIALTEVKARGTRIHLAALYGEIGRFHRVQNEWDESLHYYRKAIALNKEFDFPRAVGLLSSSISDVYLALKNYDEALHHIDESLKIATRLGFKKDKQEFLFKKALLLEKTGKSVEAVALMKESMILLKEISNGENQITVARLHLEYETEKKNRDLTSLATQNRMKEIEIEEKQLLMLLGLVTGALSIVLVAVVYRKHRQSSFAARTLTLQKDTIEKQNLDLKDQSALKEKLLHEIHHRVKNNLQIIMSIIHLKSNSLSSEAQIALNQLNGRIFSMGLIHEKLYRSENIQIIRLDTYLSELCHYLIQSLSNASDAVNLEFECPTLELDIDRTLTCGLICNELVTNTLKHAFISSQQCRTIKSCIALRQGNIVWLVQDNGKNRSGDPPNLTDSFGLRFVDQLVTSKLEGQWHFEFKYGFSATMTFPLSTPWKRSE